MGVNTNKTKVMISGEWQKVMQKAARWPCGVCGRGVGCNSIQCTSYQKTVRKENEVALQRAEIKIVRCK